jgi:TolA-binding protein
MKRIDRKHLKEDELVHTISVARDFIAPRKRQVTGIVIVLALVAAVVLGVNLIRQRTSTRGEELLAQAMVALNARVVPATPGQAGDVPAAAQFNATGTFSSEEAKLNAALPKLQAAADAYPDTQAGITARYHLASALSSLGRHDEAIKAFDEVTQRAGSDSLYGRMAKLGKADTQAHAGNLDAAIAVWKELAGQQDSDIPQDAILMELARAYVAKGDVAEAKKTFTQVVDQHPDSPYSAEARMELEGLKG